VSERNARRHATSQGHMATVLAAADGGGGGQEPHLISVLTTPEFALDPACKEGQLLQLLVVEKVVDRPSAPTRAK
jgi:hypothetical protein